MSNEDTPGVDADFEDEDEEAPLSELAEAIEQRREEEVSAEETELFESVEVGEVDVEDVWEELQTEEEEALETQRVGAGAEAEHVGQASETDEREEWVVPKREFCQRCQFFSSPPETACSHEGTDIAEVVDSEHFRVRGCPMVGQERLQGITKEPE